jgi:hypothetical protein
MGALVSLRAENCCESFKPWVFARFILMSSDTSDIESSSSVTSWNERERRSVERVKQLQSTAQSNRTERRIGELFLQDASKTRATARKGFSAESRASRNSARESSSEDVRGNQRRRGKGEIDRFAFKKDDYQRKRKEYPTTKSAPVKESPVGPASGLPHPTPDPRYNPPFARTAKVVVESKIWTGIRGGEGFLEWSRVSESGHQEWLSARQAPNKAWTITRSRSTKL